MSTVGTTDGYTLVLGAVGYTRVNGTTDSVDKRLSLLGCEIKRLTDTPKRAFGSRLTAS